VAESGVPQGNIEACLSGIRCPILAIQAEDDEYATMAQLDAIAARATASPRVEELRLPECAHSPHRDQPAAVQRAIERFVSTL
jgi:pimeloyl-ACP methyl ester carboxylesterase